MTTANYLGIVLVCSLALNAYQYYSCESQTSVCEVTPGYAGAIEIGADKAREVTTVFRDRLVPPDETTGGIISRTAFEEMLCLKGCNGIAYAFARDPEATVGPANNGAFMVFTGVNVTYDETDGRITHVSPIEGASLYRSGNWCPNSCLPL